MLVSGGKIIAIDGVNTTSATLSGDGVFTPLGVNTNTIATTGYVKTKDDEIKNTLSSVSSTLSSAIDEKQDQLEFGYNSFDKINKINGSALAAGNNVIVSAGDDNVHVQSATEGENTIYSISITANPTDVTVSGEHGLSAKKIPSETQTNFTLGLTQTAYNAVTSVSSKLDTTAFSTVSGTFLTKSSADNDYAPISITTTVNTLTAASAGWNNKVDKPTSLNDKYLVLRTDSNGAVSGWCDFQDQSYSKSEALGTFVATANIDTTTLSGDGKSVSTKLGVKTDVIATIDYVNSSFLPLSGGTVSGLTTISGSDFDNTLEVKRAGQANNFAHIGLNNSRGLSFKAFDTNASTNVQFDLFPNNSNSALIQVQHNGSTVGNLIPAVTATTTAGLTNDGILHIILES